MITQLPFARLNQQQQLKEDHYSNYQKLPLLTICLLIILQGAMRTTFQKRKFTAALEQINPGQIKAQGGTSNQKRGDQPSISIINLDSYKREANRRGRNFKKINPLATFSLPHSNYHSKVFRFLLQSAAVNEESQLWAAKLKCENIKRMNQKKNCSHVQNVESQQTLNKGRVGKGEVCELIKTQVRSHKKANRAELEDNLIESIKLFRKRQTSYTSQLSQIDSDDPFLTQNKQAKTSESIFLQKKASQLVENYKHWKKEEAVYRLKLQVKNKLSRKHMYHTLKQKQDVYNQIKVSLTEPSYGRQISGSSGIVRNVQSIIVEKCKPKSKSLDSKNLKNYTYSILQPEEQLKIESKAAQIVWDISKCKEEYIRTSLIKMQKGLQVAGKNVEKNRNINRFMRSPIKQERLSTLWTRKAQSDRKDNLEKSNIPLMKEMRLLEPVKEVESQFRNLTPWRDNIDQ